MPSLPRSLPTAPSYAFPEPVAARRALVEAERANEVAGHEIAGALSSQYGFLPRRTPATKLTPEFAVLDEIAEALPTLFTTMRLRSTLDRLGDIRVDAIPEPLLQRAVTVLGLLVQSYWHCDLRAPAGIPERLDRAWAAVCARMGREAPVFTYGDGIVNNFRIPGVEGAYDPIAQLPAQLQLLVPTVDNAEERIFYLTQVAILMQSAWSVEAATRLQECIVANDREHAKSLLVYVRDVVQHLTDVTFMTIDPNPASRTHVDPTVWTRTVANTFLPFRPGPPGPSGTASPVIHLFDVLFGRKRYDATKISRETIEMRHQFPIHQRRYLAALGETDLRGWVAKQGDPELSGLLAQALVSYTGDNGFLGRHRLKVYCYLDTAFKLGRDATIGGFSQLLVDRTWDHVHEQLTRMRDERLGDVSGASLTHVTRAQSSDATIDGGSSDVQRVRLDISGVGLRYRPGDRLAVLPENHSGLVARTLEAFGLKGHELVPLGAAWKAALALRPRFHGGAVPDAIPVRDMLRWARLRPVTHAQAGAILEIAPNPAVQAIVDNHIEDELELWDLVMLSRRDHPRFEITIAAALVAGRLDKLLPPEDFRLYSIASAPDGDNSFSRTLDLVVTRWQYTTRDAVAPTTAALAHTVPLVRRRGTASNYLIREAQSHEARSRELFERFDIDGDGSLTWAEIEGRLVYDGMPVDRVRALFAESDQDRSGGLNLQEFSARMARLWLEAEGEAEASHEAHRVVVQVVSPPRFSLPEDPSAPVVMFAAGTGISPFRAFWQHRAALAETSMNLLYFATRSEKEFYLRDEIAALEARGRLRTRAAFSRGQTRARFDREQGRFVFEPGEAQHLDAVLEEEREAAHLYRLILPRDQGGLGGHFYICGRSGFANSVVASLKRIIARFHPGVPGTLEPPADYVLRTLVAENRLCMDIFTTHRGPSELPKTYRPSDLVLRNCAEHGYWILVNGRVLDMTEFRLLHPGGPQIIDNYAGIDATKAYVAVQHHLSSEIHAMAGMYEIGRLERITLPANPVGRLPDGTTIDLDTTLRTWLRAAYAVAECENLLANEYSIQSKVIRGGTGPNDPTGMRTLFGVAAQQRMESRYIASLFGDRLAELWKATVAFAGRGDAEAMRAQVAAIEASEASVRRRALAERLWTRFDAVAHDTATPEHVALRALSNELRERNHALLRDLKLAIRRGLIRFERLEPGTLEATAVSLVSLLQSMPALLVEHTEATLAAARRHGFG